MKKATWVIAILCLGSVLPLAAQSTQQESLGDVARQVRQQKTQGPQTTTKVLTNDNLPAPVPGDITVLPASPDASTPAADKDKPVAADKDETKPESKDYKSWTRDQWQGKFKVARQDLAHAKEKQQLAEDELNLLQIQQARELDPVAKQGLDDKIAAKQSEVDVNKSTTAAAQQALDDLQKDFKDSGAPDDWSVTDEPKEPTSWLYGVPAVTVHKHCAALRGARSRA